MTVRLAETGDHEATEGSAFLERFGSHRSEARDTEFGQQELSTQVYTASAADVEANEPALTVPETVVVDGAERRLNHLGCTNCGKRHRADEWDDAYL